MDVTKLQNKQGYFFDGDTLLIGVISGDKSPYCKKLAGRVAYSKPLMSGCFRFWSLGYEYHDWDWRNFEFIPSYAFLNLEGYLKFLDNADIDEIKAYLKIKDLMKTEDFQQCCYPQITK